MNTKKITLIVALIILLVILFVWLKPKKTEAPTDGVSTATVAETRTFELGIAGRKIVSGPQVLKAIKDDKIVLRVTSDEAEELHVHGIDISLDLEPNKVATVIFTANLTGGFAFELEKSGTELGTLEIMPR